MWYKIRHNWTSALIVLAGTSRKVKPVGNDLDVSIFRKTDCTLKFQNLSQQARFFFFPPNQALIKFQVETKKYLGTTTSTVFLELNSLQEDYI